MIPYVLIVDKVTLEWVKRCGEICEWRQVVLDVINCEYLTQRSLLAVGKLLRRTSCCNLIKNSAQTLLELSKASDRTRKISKVLGRNFLIPNVTNELSLPSLIMFLMYSYAQLIAEHKREEILANRKLSSFASLQQEEKSPEEHCEIKNCCWCFCWWKPKFI